MNTVVVNNEMGLDSLFLSLIAVFVKKVFDNASKA